MKVTSNNIQSLKSNEIIVFGSNGFGRHDGGLARVCVEKFGAIYGKANGIQGQCYAINTMDGLQNMQDDIRDFIKYVLFSPHQEFLLTEIGCGIAGYKPEQIAPLFEDAFNLSNISFPESFIKILTHNK